jgi:hypothetical protein
VRAPAGREDEVINDVTYTLRRERNAPVEAPNNFGVNRRPARNSTSARAPFFGLSFSRRRKSKAAGTS